MASGEKPSVVVVPANTVLTGCSVWVDVPHRGCPRVTRVGASDRAHAGGQGGIGADWSCRGLAFRELRHVAVPATFRYAAGALAKRRNPRQGACFMELASYLAGERWSDHPACTHSLLASVARLVNDHTSDEGRPRLAELIPSVIGLTGDDLHIDALITSAARPSRCRSQQPIDSGSSRSRSWSASGCWHNSTGAEQTASLQPVSTRWAQYPKQGNGPTASPLTSLPGQQPSAGRPHRAVSCAVDAAARADPGS